LSAFELQKIKLVQNKKWEGKPCMPNSSVALPSILQEFIDSKQWTFAETMPEWPHEYIVRGRVDYDLFVRLVQHIRQHGYEGQFYRKSITYYYAGGMVYWTTGAPLGETFIVYRCKIEDSYEYRLVMNKLPKAKGIGTEQIGAGDALQRV
jgi:hypothetical protein